MSDFGPGVGGAEKLQGHIQRHEVSIYIGDFNFLLRLHCPKPIQPLTSDLGNLSFEMGKLFFHQKWVMALFSQLRNAVEVFLRCHAIGLGTKNTI